MGESGLQSRPGHFALIAMGANRAFGNMEPAQTLQQALKALQQAALLPMQVSDLWRSPAWPPGHGAPDYCNAVVLVDPGAVPPDAVLARLHRIEDDLGRVRDPADRWAARTLDLDLIDQDGRVVVPAGDPPVGLVLPHPRAHARDFVLAPLLQVMPHWCHPVTGTSGAVLLDGVRAALSPDQWARHDGPLAPAPQR